VSKRREKVVQRQMKKVKGQKTKREDYESFEERHQNEKM
jgi:hypothetical protein